MMVIGQFGADTLAASREVDAALADLAPALERRGVVLHDDLFRPAGYIQRSLAGLSEHVAAGSALVVAVLVAFLFDARTAFISALAIPLSLAAAALALLEMGMSLNVMALGGLAIALGRGGRRRDHRHRERVPPPAREPRRRRAAPGARGGVRRVDGGPRVDGPCDGHRGAGLRAAAGALRSGGAHGPAGGRRLHPRHRRVARGRADGDAGAVRPAAGEGRRRPAPAAAGPRPPARLRTAAARGGAPRPRGHGRGGGGRGRRPRRPARPRRTLPPRAARGPLHDPHLRRSRRLARRDDADRNPAHRAGHGDPRGAEDVAMGRAGRARRRHLRQPLRRIRGRSRPLAGRRPAARPRFDPRSARPLSGHRRRGQHLPRRARRGDRVGLRRRGRGQRLRREISTCWSARAARRRR